MNKTRFEFLNISKEDKELILKLSPKSELFLLAPLDKGLSGSLTLLAKWYLPNTEIETKFHVLKIGDAQKLQKEHDAISGIAAPMIKDFPYVDIKFSEDRNRAILSQQFIGDEKGINKSLKQFIEQTSNINDIKEIINALYKNEIIKWVLPKNRNIKSDKIKKNKKKTTFEEIFKDWINKGEKNGGLNNAANEIGISSINESLYEHFNLRLQNIILFLQSVYKDVISIKVGPVHGDLHSQNIVLDTANRICLIDFGWTNYRWQAIDFIWLECSLKFVVCTPYIKIDDFILVENMLNEYWGRENEIPYNKIQELYHGYEIAKVVSGIAAIRENARDLKVINNQQEYLKGLIIMTSSLSTFPQLNRGTLFHSLGANIQKLNNKQKKAGTYDKLYISSDNMLWPEKPGRMVEAAIEIMKEPGKCLDIGCGDGKNMLFLENLGWNVIGIDISKYAIRAAFKRYEQKKKKIVGELILDDAVEYKYPNEVFDLVVCYGLYHCLSDEEIKQIHAPMIGSIKRGGLFAFCALNNSLPVPNSHGTGDIYLREPSHIFDIIGNDLIILKKQYGEITESHLPLVNEHKHSLTWALFKKQ